MSRRSPGQRGVGRIPRDQPLLSVAGSAYPEEAVQRFLDSQEGQLVVWIYAGPKGPRNAVRDTLASLEESGDIERWKDWWGRFKVWL